MDYRLKGQLACARAGAHGIGEAIRGLPMQEEAAVIVVDHDEAVLNEKEKMRHTVVFLASPLAKFIAGAGLDIGGTIRGLI
jgi:hypothetical protein